MKRKLFILIVGGMVLAGCKELYDPKIELLKKHFLIIEALMTGGTGPSRVQLSMTTDLNQNIRLSPVTNAVITAESRTSTIGTFSHKGNGLYEAAPLNLNYGEEYRIIIKANGKDYASDFVTAKRTPEIDSINWKRTEEGVTIYANTHDPQSNTRYYKWEYDETWEINSAHHADVRFRGDALVTLTTPSDPEIYFCWKFGVLTSLKIATSAHLSQDKIIEEPLTFIPAKSEKLGVRYSILVTQYAIERKAYEFFQLMKRNTESIGTVFDPQPVELVGNVRCTSHPDEPALGYLIVSEKREKRVFIRRSDVSNWGFRLDCTEKLVSNNPDSIRTYMPSFLPYLIEYSPGGSIAGYHSASNYCIDCRQRGAINVKPTYW